MNESLLPLLIPAVVVLVVVIVAVGWYVEKRRREELQAFAEQRGWTYERRDDSWARAFDGRPFRSGHDREAHHVFRGMHDGRDFVGFELVYHTTDTDTDSNGNSTSREVEHWYSVLALRTSDRMPRLEVSPEGFFGRAFGKLTNRDIQLESEEFNRAFTVVCKDRRFASDILHPRLMERLLRTPRTGWRIDNGWILQIEDGKHRLESLDGRLSVTDGVLDAVPDFVREQYGLPARGLTGNEDF